MVSCAVISINFFCYGSTCIRRTDHYFFFFIFLYIGILIIDNGASRRRTRNARFRARRADHYCRSICIIDNGASSSSFAMSVQITINEFFICGNSVEISNYCIYYTNLLDNSKTKSTKTNLVFSNNLELQRYAK